MNKIAAPITFIPHSKDRDISLDSSFLSDGEIFEMKQTHGFISLFLEITNSKKVS